MVLKGENTTSRITTLKNEVMKTFAVYDGSDRLIELYEAVTTAEDGDPCLKTEYAYIAASTRVEKTKESYDVWLAIWEI